MRMELYAFVNMQMRVQLSYCTLMASRAIAKVELHTHLQATKYICIFLEFLKKSGIVAAHIVWYTTK